MTIIDFIDFQKIGDIEINTKNIILFILFVSGVIGIIYLLTR